MFNAIKYLAIDYKQIVSQGAIAGGKYIYKKNVDYMVCDTKKQENECP